ncbi:hypothetical protein V2W45_275202 [Cenococcum geophilum]
MMYKQGISIGMQITHSRRPLRILQIACANNTILTDYTPGVSPPLAIMWLHHNIPKWMLDCFNKVSRGVLWDCAQELVGFINGWSELSLEFPLTPVKMAWNLVPRLEAKIRLFFAERSNGTFNDDALSSVWIEERLRAILVANPWPPKRLRERVRLAALGTCTTPPRSRPSATTRSG